GADALQVVLRVRGELGPEDARAARGASEDVAAVLRLHGRPRAPADVREERVEVALERLRREGLAVGVCDREALDPVRPPVDQVDGRLDLDADRAGACAAAV